METAANISAILAHSPPIRITSDTEDAVQRTMSPAMQRARFGQSLSPGVGTPVSPQNVVNSAAAFLASLQKHGLWLGPRAQLYVRVGVLLAALLNVVVFPALLAFGGPISTSRPLWFAALWIGDLVLWGDIGARFCIPMHKDDFGTKLSHREVAYRQLRSLKLLEDVICRFPFEVVVAIVSARPFEFGDTHVIRLLILPRALSILAARLGPLEQHRFVGAKERLGLLGLVSVVGLHLYGCCTWMVAAQLQAAGRSSWLTYAASEAEGVEPADWPMWEKYVRAFDRGFLVVLGEGQRGQTREEVKSRVGRLVLSTHQLFLLRRPDHHAPGSHHVFDSR